MMSRKPAPAVAPSSTPKAKAVTQTGAPGGANAKTYNQLTTEQDKLMDDFFKVLTEMLRSLKTKAVNNDDLMDLWEKYNLARVNAPHTTFVGAGKVIWKYKDRIIARDENFFITQSFEKDIAEARQALPEAAEFDRFSDILNNIKLLWHTLSAGERTLIFTQARTLVGQYVSFEQNRRALEAMAGKQ
jgi:hypothetical protein